MSATGALAVVTMTWVRTAEEERRLSRAIDVLASYGHPVVVADRGTSESFTRLLEDRDGVQRVAVSKPGLVPQIKAAVERARRLEPDWLLYVEPDKEQFFHERLPGFLQRALSHDDAALVLAARSPASFATFPPMQRQTEHAFNTLCAHVTGVHGDYLYGPFVMRTTVAAHLHAVSDTLGWGWRPALFMTARRQGHRLLHDVDEHPCPDDQRTEDESDRAHRLRQLSQNVLGLVE
jgi:hypothetical protein